MRKSRIKVAILNNTLPPYRIPIYRNIGREFDTVVILSGREDNRTTWQGVDEQLTREEVRVLYARGTTFKYRNQEGQRVFDQRYLHINPGYLADLWREKPDAVLSTEMGFRTLSALAYSIRFGKPVWIWWGGTMHTERNRSILKRAMRKLIVKLARHWISYGMTSSEYLRAIGVPANQIVQIQNGVDETLYSRPVEPAVSLNPRPVLLYAGQFVGRKGVEHLIRAAGRMQAAGYVFSLLTVGEGPEKQNMAALVKELKVANVHFIHGQRNEDMPGYYRSADFLVFPTLEDVWGLVVNEALWAGVPVLSSIYAGCSAEIVPLGNRFDPLNAIDFDRVLHMALNGKISPVDLSPLVPLTESSQRIADDIHRYVRPVV